MPEPHRLNDGDVVPLFEDAAGVSFSPSRAFDLTSFPSGGAGAIGSGPEVHTILETIRRDAEDGKARLLTREMARSLFQSQIGNLETEPGRAFSIAGTLVTNPAIGGTPQSAGTLTWGGVYGHSWFIDPVAAITAVILTNTIFEGMNGQVTLDIRDAIYSR